MRWHRPEQRLSPETGYAIFGGKAFRQREEQRL